MLALSQFLFSHVDGHVLRYTDVCVLEGGTVTVAPKSEFSAHALDLSMFPTGFPPHTFSVNSGLILNFLKKKMLMVL